MGNQSDVINLAVIAPRQHKSKPDVDYSHQRCTSALGCNDITIKINAIAFSEGNSPANEEKLYNFKLYNAIQVKEIFFAIQVEHLFS